MIWRGGRNLHRCFTDINTPMGEVKNKSTVKFPLRLLLNQGAIDSPGLLNLQVYSRVKDKIKLDLDGFVSKCGGGPTIQDTPAAEAPLPKLDVEYGPRCLPDSL